MKYAVILLAAALFVPATFAAPNAQTGNQTGYYWSQSTLVAAQGGTNFVLAGIAGDHDVLFLTASGGYAGFFLACGPDRGVVPSNAAYALILVWDHDSVPGTCIALGVAPSSQFVYVDGF